MPASVRVASGTSSPATRALVKAINCQPVTDRAAIQRQIDSIRDGGGTTISKGMKSGLDELRKALDPNRVNRMLLLTDGETFGDEKKCIRLASELGQMGVPVYALGLGEDWNEKLLDEIATKSGGLSDFIDQPAKITRVFEDMVSMAKGTVVQNAQMILRLVIGVSPRAVWQVLPIISKLDHRVLSDRDVQIDLGDMEKDQGQSVLVEFLVSPRQEGRYRIAQAEVSYDVPAMGLVGEKAKVDILMNFTGDPQLAQQTDPRVMNIIEKVPAHKLQT
ncbi:MAG TPA: VWA domain-containing protein, partial [Planctomycetaceae bacterium]|nr:VWA domain-containing protein [Planctomycetaceae bacterium]